MCVTEYGTMYVDVALILPIPGGGEEACSCQRQCRNRKVCQAVVQLSPAQIDTHVTSMMDTKMSSITRLASELKDSDYERPSVPHQNKLFGLRAPASIGLTDVNDCIIHPPAAPSSRHSACQSQSSCLEQR